MSALARLSTLTRRDMDDRTMALVRRAAAVCLRYPGDAFAEQLTLVRGAADELPARQGAAADALRRFVDFAAKQDPYDLAADYVEAFDQRNRSSLYLTWWTAGDTRNRGVQLVHFIEAYRAAGYEYGGEELPDYLPVVLEFASCGDAGVASAGTRLLAEHRSVLVKLLESLAGQQRSQYAQTLAPVLAAILETVHEPLAYGDLR